MMEGIRSRAGSGHAWIDQYDKSLETHSIHVLHTKE